MIANTPGHRVDGHPQRQQQRRTIPATVGELRDLPALAVAEDPPGLRVVHANLPVAELIRLVAGVGGDGEGR